MIGRVDPFLTGFGLASAGNTFISMNALRADNTVRLRLADRGWLQGRRWLLDRHQWRRVGRVQRQQLRRSIFGANWASGPFFAAATYDVVNNAGSAPDQKHIQIGGTFDIAVLPPARRLGQPVEHRQPVTPVTGGTGSFITLPTGFQNFDATSWMLGATWTVSPAIKVFGSYQALRRGRPRRLAGVNFEPDYNVMVDRRHVQPVAPHQPVHELGLA